MVPGPSSKCMMALPEPPRATPARGGERGIALLLVLLLSLILIPFAGEFAMQVRLESQTAVNVSEELQIDNAIDGQYEVMLAHLRYDAQANDVDSLDDDWNKEEVLSRTEEGPDVALTTHPFDEQAKFNVRMLADSQPERRKLQRERFQRLLQEVRRDTPFEISSTDAETWTNQVAEYVTKGALRANLPTPKMRDERTILALGELEVLPSVHDQRFSALLGDQRKDDEVAPGLHRFLTVYGTGKVNLNTVDVKVLRAFFPLNPELAERIIDRRENPPETKEGESPPPDEDPEGTLGNPYTAVDQILEVEGVDPKVLQENGVDPNADFDVRSAFFSFRIIGEKQTSRRDELFVVERVAGATPEEGLEGFRLLLRQERTDIFESVSSE